MSGSKRGTGSWRERQERDIYVQQARKDGWRSRAVYKLEQIDQKERILRPDMTCVDLGSSPGSWSQYVTGKLKGRTKIVAVDLLAMDSLPSVEFILGDFTDDQILADLQRALGDERVDLVMSDMAPNISGNRVVDQPRAMYLAELALDFAARFLSDAGTSSVSYFKVRAATHLLQSRGGHSRR